MTFLYALILLLISNLELNAGGLTTVEFKYTGDIQYFTVPPFVTTIYVDIHGAGGGTDFYGSPEYPGGLGARVQATLTVIPNATYYIYIGANIHNLC